MNDLVSPRPARLAIFSRDRHAAVRVAMPRRFPDVAGLSAIPLVVNELGEAAAYYPIAFVGAEHVQLAAIVAIAPNQNLFLEPDGTWADGVYVPALLRRRPFSIARTDKAETFAIMIDENDVTLSQEGGAALFDGDKPSALGEDFLKLTRELQPAVGVTEIFIKALQQHGLLVPRTATFTIEGRQGAVLQGMQLIDPEKLAALPEATVIEWHRNGFLAAIAYINGSQGRFQTLLHRARLRDGAGA